MNSPSALVNQKANSTALHSEPILRKCILPPLPVAKESSPEEPVHITNSAPVGPELSGVVISTNTETVRSSLLTFKDAGNAIKLQLKATQGFNTLRDMGGVNIQPSDLKSVRKLGEGAFAVVEEADYSPAAPTTHTKDFAKDGDALRPVSASAPCHGPARRVAVKRLKPDVVNHADDLASFLQEVAVLRKLAHRRVVEFIGVGSSDTSSEEARRRTMFLVQEFMDGGTLKRLISRQMLDQSLQLYSFTDAFRWALHMAEGLEYLHGTQPVVIHRDLKLENILLKGTNPHSAEAKIADFGLVALIRHRVRRGEGEGEGDCFSPGRSSGGASNLNRVTSIRKKPSAVHEVLDQSFHRALSRMSSRKWLRSQPPQQLSGRTGSYMYMAPEMYRQEQYNEKVDVFSFGVILFEMLSRYQMVCAISLAGTEEELELYAARVAEGYRPPLPTKWPETVRELVALCWHQDPEMRPCMSWVRERLEQHVSQGVPQAMQMVLPPPSCACRIM